MMPAEPDAAPLQNRLPLDKLGALSLSNGQAGSYSFRPCHAFTLSFRRKGRKLLKITYCSDGPPSGAEL